SRSSSYATGLEKKAGIPQNWDSLYQITQAETVEQLSLHQDRTVNDPATEHTPSSSAAPDVSKHFFQLHNRFIVSQIHSGFMMIDEQEEHEPSLIETNLEQLEHHQGSSQHSLLPQTVELIPADFALMEDILPEIHTLGCQTRPF